MRSVSGLSNATGAALLALSATKNPSRYGTPAKKSQSLGSRTSWLLAPPPPHAPRTATPAARPAPPAVSRRTPRRSHLLATARHHATSARAVARGACDTHGVAVPLVVDGREVCARDEGASLLEFLRDELGVRSAKDGCSPQGQCGCCTVLVEGAPRVACVTPVRRVAGRQVTTIAGMPEAGRWAEAFTAHGASQCGFCTPGIIVRLAV